MKSLAEHYESDTTQAMTKKISEIASFKGILSPMIQRDGQFVFDLKSRYFTEDFPYGLCIIKGFAEIFHIITPSIDRVLLWYQKLTGQELFKESNYCGADLIKTAIPQNFGIYSAGDVYQFYG